MCLYSLWRTSTNQNRRGAIKQSDTLDFPEGQTKDKQVCLDKVQLSCLVNASVLI